MPRETKVVAAFKARLEELEQLTGNKYEIMYPEDEFRNALNSNRLSANWFEPGTLLAKATGEDNTVLFEVVGNLSADVYDADGVLVTSFVDRITPIEEDETGFRLLDDKDLDMLLTDSHPSGCILRVLSENKVYAHVENKKLQPVVSNETSIARTILDRDIVEGLMTAAADAPDISASAKKATKKLSKIDLPPESVFTEEEKKAEEDVKAAEVVTEVPEEEPMKEASEEVVQTEVSEAPEEPVAVEPEAEEAEPVKAKPARKSAKAKKKEEKAEEAEPEKGPELLGRCDLLPLDAVGDFFDIEDTEGNVYGAIEEFKKYGNPGDLLHAARIFSAVTFDSPETAVLELAVKLEEDAIENGERAWEETLDVKDCVNLGIRHLLQIRRGDKDMRHDREFLMATICGAWICMHHPEKNPYM